MNDADQPLQPLTSDRRDQAKLSHVGTYGVRELDPLPHQHRTRAVEHHHALLLRRLHLDVPHRGPGHGLADRFRIRAVILLPLDIRLHVAGWHQTHIMAQSAQLPSPIMRCRARLDADKTALQLLEKRNHPRSRQLPLQYDLASRIHAVHLKNPRRSSVR